MTIKTEEDIDLFLAGSARYYTRNTCETCMVGAAMHFAADECGFPQERVRDMPNPAEGASFLQWLVPSLSSERASANISIIYSRNDTAKRHGRAKAAFKNALREGLGLKKTAGKDEPVASATEE